MEDIQIITERLLDAQSISFIGSVDEGGFPQIRAMLRPRKREGIGTIYYSTNQPTNKVKHFLRNEKACVYVCDSQTFEGALLTGTMEVLASPAYKELLWQPGDEMYYPGGVTDPGYCVLRFTVRTIRTYHAFHSASMKL